MFKSLELCLPERLQRQTEDPCTVHLVRLAVVAAVAVQWPSLLVSMVTWSQPRAPDTAVLSHHTDTDFIVASY